MSDMIFLRAELEKREEDLRIARKHRDEAAARPMNAENRRAYESAHEWVGTCDLAAQVARGAVIRASLLARNGDASEEKRLAEDAESRVADAATQGERDYWLRMASHWWTRVVEIEDAVV